MRALLLLTAVSSVAADSWAVLVAGSNGYYNYRHQSDVCHSYQVLKKNGFSDDRIITMFYDDIARNPSNPVQNNLINQPDGPNVYTGCKKDYTGNLVTPSNFLKVLAGEKMTVGSKKTLETTENDDIFVFFSDHGATGILAFPSDELHALDLNNTITKMYEGKKYRQMLIYIEACEAGSMFNNILSPNVNVMAVTASDPTHSSYAIYWDDSRQAYLGDVFSVFWMQDSEVESLTETVEQQFDIVQKETNTSAVCSYGDVSISKEALKIFQAPPNAQPSASARNRIPMPAGEVMDSRDIHMAALRHKLDAATPADRPRIAGLLSAELRRRQKHDDRMKYIASAAAGIIGRNIDFIAPRPNEEDICHPKDQTVTDPVCLKQMVSTMKSICGPFDDYSLKYVRVLNSFCSVGVSHSQMVQPMKEACSA